jgi:hypothetical protein
MDEVVKEVIPLLQYLIPGFLTAWIFYSLTAFKRPDTFGQIVQALIFTFVIHGGVLLVQETLLWGGNRWGALGEWSAKADAFWSFVLAVSVGLMACYLANNDRLHGWLRARGVTRKTSHPTEWFSAFAGHKRFVVLHFTDERRLYGWPLEWPSEPKDGQFVIQEPAWLDERGNEFPLALDLIVVDASSIRWVEFTTLS